MFTKAGNGEITSDEFLKLLGYENPGFYMRDYIENHLTIDEGFYTFAENMRHKYNYALLSNDVSEWSNHIIEFHNLNKYLPVRIISGDVHCRKPDVKIFEIAMERLNIPAKDCIFIDNSVQNLLTAETLGMETILFNRNGEKYNGKTVYSFDELFNLLSL